MGEELMVGSAPPGLRRGMLISHVKSFIYLKTVKTAGTSVEIFFERYCKPPAQAESEDHGRPELVCNEGIVGCRQADRGASVWYNHMKGSEVRALIGDDIWSRYFKFCVIRNPFDQLVSYWWMAGVGDDANKAREDFDFARDRFSRWVLDSPCLALDRSIYTIDGKHCVDEMIRYEDLLVGVRRVCERIGVPADLNRLGRFKAEFRRRPEAYQDYYTWPARERVERDLAGDLASLRYAFE